MLLQPVPVFERIDPAVAAHLQNNTLIVAVKDGFRFPGIRFHAAIVARRSPGGAYLDMDKPSPVKTSTARRIRMATDSLAKGFSFRPEDWKIRPELRHMLHMPSRLTFVVDLDEDAVPEQPSLHDYYAEPLRLPGDERQYHPDQLQKLGAVAVILYLIAEEKLDIKFGDTEWKITGPLIRP